MRRRAAHIAGRTAVVILAGAWLAGCGESSPSAKGTDTTAPVSTQATVTTMAPLTTSSTAAASVPAGYTAFTSKEDRYSLAVPKDWRQIDPSSPTAAQAVKDAVKLNPALGSVISPENLTAQGIKYLAVNGTGASVNMVVKPAAGARDSDLPSIVDAIKAQYPSIGGTVTGTETVQLSGRTAAKVSSDIQMNQAAGASKLSQVQYVLLANDLAYILTLSGQSPVFPAIAATLRIS